MLSCLLFQGVALAIPEKDNEKVKRLDLKVKAIEGDLNSMFQLGMYYLLRRETVLAEKWFKKASYQNHIPSLWKWVGVLQRKPVQEAALDLQLALEKLIELKEFKAHLELGDLYINPKSELFNFKIGRMHYEFSALKGNATAMLRLGHLFLGEDDHPQDFTQAYQWFGHAAEKDLGEAHRFLAMCFRYGLGIEKNLQKAWVQYGLGAKQGDLESAYTLAEALYVGEEVTQDKGLARRYYQQAAKYGYKDAQRKLKELSF
jgi:TPR repeat protein